MDKITNTDFIVYEPDEEYCLAPIEFEVTEEILVAEIEALKEELQRVNKHIQDRVLMLEKLRR